jgi:hypothetical protein
MDPWFKQKQVEGVKLQALAEHAELEKKFVHHYKNEGTMEQVVWRFPNGYGASVACSQYTHYNPELAVVKWHEEGEWNYTVVCNTEITSDVIPHVSVGDVRRLLERIKTLTESAS